MCPHTLPLMFLQVFILLIALNTQNLVGNYIFYFVLNSEIYKQQIITLSQNTFLLHTEYFHQ